ncbi:MAG: sulfotransferase, partial [Nitrososphaeraceae archaeon]
TMDLVSQKSNVICIIGMHRSGTSMIARLLNLYGLDLGPEEKLLGPNASNALGHFEHTDFLKIDDELLEHFGGSWDNPPDLEPGWQHDSSLEKFVHEAKSLVSTFSESNTWGWKEPRTTILLPFWGSLLPNLRFVICLRSPVEVARSLVGRDGISIEKSFYLWNHYMRAAIRDTEGYPRIFTFYEDYFRDASTEIERLVDFCGLPKQDDLSQVQAAIVQDLRHHTSETLELLEETNVATEYKLLYICLRAVSFREFVPTGSKDGVSENISKFLQLIDKFHNQDKMSQLETALAERDQELSKLQSRMKKREQQIQEQMAQLQEHTARLQAFSDQVRQSLAYRFYRKFIKPFSRAE